MHTGHLFDGRLGDDPPAFQLTAVEDHLVEPGHVGGGGEKTAGRVRGSLAGVVDQPMRSTLDRFLLLARLVEPRQSLPPLARQTERRVHHRERAKDPLFEEFVVRLSRHHLDHATANVQPRAVLPARAGLEPQRPFDDHLHRFLQRAFGALASAQPRSVGQEIAEGDLPRGRAAFERYLLECGDVFGDGVVDRELAFVLENHHRGGRDRLGHRRDREDGVLSHRPLVLRVGVTGGFEVDHASTPRHQRDRARNLLRLDKLTHPLLYPRQPGGVHPRSGRLARPEGLRRGIGGPAGGVKS